MALRKLDARVLMVGLGMALGSAGAQTPNTLTTDEATAGYELLFNGKDLQNWKTFHQVITPASWKITTEADYKVIEVVAGDVGHIFTKDSTFRDFDFKIEWKVPVAGNSGIFIRYREDASNSDSWGGISGPEAQVVDIAHSDGQKPLHRAGTCYDMFPLDQGRDNWWKPTGQWNQFRIIAHNKHVAHYGNGKKLLEYEMLSPTWLTAFEASKYRANAVYKTVHKGAIYLQHHGQLGIKYRNMRIKRLTQDPWAAGSKYLKAGGPMLIDDLTFEDNLFAVTTGIAPLGTGSLLSSLRIVPEGAGLSLLFPKRDNYTLQVYDVGGKLTRSESVRDAERYYLPTVQADQGRILSVSSDGATIHKGLIGPR